MPESASPATPAPTYDSLRERFDWPAPGSGAGQVGGLRGQQRAAAERLRAGHARHFHAGGRKARHVPRVQHAGYRALQRDDPIGQRIDDVGNRVARVDPCAHWRAEHGDTIGSVPASGVAANSSSGSGAGVPSITPRSVR